MSSAPPFILASVGEAKFHLAMLGLKIKPVLDIEADTKAAAIATVKSIIKNLDEFDGWSGELESSGLRIINPSEESSRWLIDFSPTFDEVNADLLTPTVPKGWVS